jgi:tripartite-type tricarboxylate transporter receptor subunit TctC
MGTHFALVPYRGAAPTIQDLVAGQIDLSFSGVVPLPLVRAGQSHVDNRSRTARRRQREREARVA